MTCEHCKCMRVCGSVSQHVLPCFILTASMKRRAQCLWFQVMSRSPHFYSLKQKWWLENIATAAQKFSCCLKIIGICGSEPQNVLISGESHPFGRRAVARPKLCNNSNNNGKGKWEDNERKKRKEKKEEKKKKERKRRRKKEWYMDCPLMPPPPPRISQIFVPDQWFRSCDVSGFSASL